MPKDFYQALKDRRTYYAISKQSDLSDERIVELVADAVKHSPSAFNSQSARVIVLLGGEHDKLWNLTKEELRKIVPAEQFAATEQRIGGFAAGYGTVLFFEDYNVVKTLQDQFATYKDNFPIWSHHSSGMLQHIVWTSLVNEGLGASLQHYSPLIDEAVQREWNVPAGWKLVAQMPFGKPTAEPGEKQFQPVEDRVVVYK